MPVAGGRLHNQRFLRIDGDDLAVLDLMLAEDEAAALRNLCLRLPRILSDRDAQRVAELAAFARGDTDACSDAALRVGLREAFRSACTRTSTSRRGRRGRGGRGERGVKRMDAGAAPPHPRGRGKGLLEGAGAGRASVVEAASPDARGAHRARRRWLRARALALRGAGAFRGARREAAQTCDADAPQVLGFDLRFPCLPRAQSESAPSWATLFPPPYPFRAMSPGRPINHTPGLHLGVLLQRSPQSTLFGVDTISVLI